MRIFNYWVTHSKELLVDGEIQVSKTIGGSDISPEEAAKDATRKLATTQQIINGERVKDGNYEADIVEEIIERIDENNIVTRNRYGALVLNSSNVMFIDIDHYSRSFFDRIFKSSWSDKQFMLKRIEQTVNRESYRGLDFRVYETFRGYRLLVTGETFDSHSAKSVAMMSDFNADFLYSMLCIRQHCYRARLTPKPARIKQKGLKIRFPYTGEEQKNEQLKWISEYTGKSAAYSTCKLISVHGNNRTNQVIDYHDKLTGIKTGKKLG